MSTYSVLGSTSRPRRRGGDTPFIDDVDWWDGVPITVPLPSPFVLKLDPFAPWSQEQSPYLGVVLDTNPPVWRDDFIDVLLKAGVDNLVLYDMVVESPPNTEIIAKLYERARQNGIVDVDAHLTNLGHRNVASWPDPELRRFHNYKAVNVLGMVKAGELDEDNPVFDASRAKGRALFRLVESTNTILVRDDVRDAVLAAGFGEDLTFHDLLNVAL